MKLITKIVSSLSVAGLLLTASLNSHATALVEDFNGGSFDGFFFFGDGPFGVCPIDALPCTPDFVGIPPVPGKGGDDPLLELFLPEPLGFAGVGRLLEGGPQDWSAYNSIRFWLYGQESGVGIFFNIVDDLEDPASDGNFHQEVWTYEFTDDFMGWGLVEISFDDFLYAPFNDGFYNQMLDLDRITNWAWGVGGINPAPGQPLLLRIDDIALVPTPSTLALFGLGLAGLGFVRRKKA